MSFEKITVKRPLFVHGATSFYRFEFRGKDVIIFGDRHPLRASPDATHFDSDGNVVENGDENVSVGVLVGRYLKPKGYEVCLEAPHVCKFVESDASSDAFDSASIYNFFRTYFPTEMKWKGNTENKTGVLSVYPLDHILS